MPSASEIRRTFLEFFAERGHRIVPSAPVFPKDDPTLLFTNAGMNQFKDIFLGTGRRDYTRAADTQKCIRVSGKHNDLEEVGRDTYHHTFFEMLGNWSFGDYFKREAITWAWELLTEVYGLPKDRLWATYFGGDERAGLEPDDETRRLWAECTDIPEDRILPFSAKDNFWEMGETGPCGPCTEIHLDRGGEGSDPEDGRNPEIGVNAGNERFIELWNLVFIQFNRSAEGLQPLPARHVDTGMGLERLCAVLQGKTSNYDTDLFTPIFARIEELTGKTYGGGGEADVAFRVIADHVRALSSAMADGALPGNEGRGYVLRRLLRRAARYGRQHLGMERPFIYEIVPVVAAILGEVFPEIEQRREHVMLLIREEEKAFQVTLDKGLVLFEKLAGKVEAAGSRVIPGEDAYDLYATYGFPRDLVELMARERGLSVDGRGWERAEKAHKEASRGGGGGGYLVDPSLLEGLPATRTLCHGDEECPNGLEAEATPLALLQERFLVLDRTPFYAESGGQVGDAGVVEAAGFRFAVEDTQKSGDVVIHVGRLEEGDAASLPAKVTARVDGERRVRIMANHTATHLLHWALKEVLGEHATQQGSLVAPDRLRFDFTHPRALTPEEIERIETLVNERIAADVNLRTTVEALEEARSRGVTALFGEKYEERVRVVDIGGFSTELCGGTHCRATGQIGTFVIVGESAVQAGVRRIEAVTRDAAVRRMQEQRRLLREAAASLKAREQEVPGRVKALQEQVKELKKGGEGKRRSDLSSLARELIAGAEKVGTTALVVARLDDLKGADLRSLCDTLKASGASVCGVLGAGADGKALLAALASKDIAGKRVHAGQVIREIAAIVGGGGGGRPDFAQAGGKDPARLDEALERGRELLRKALG